MQTINVSGAVNMRDLAEARARQGVPVLGLRGLKYVHCATDQAADANVVNSESRGDRYNEIRQQPRFARELVAPTPRAANS